MDVPPLGPSTPSRGNRLSSALGRGVLGLMGFGFEGAVPDVARAVMIFAPHTSNWDFPVGLSAMWSLGLRVEWLGKHTIFRGPLGVLFRFMGGIPVDRGSPEAALAKVARLFGQRQQLLIGLAPEGTRYKVDRWKSGFYRIAMASAVPILPVAFDWSVRRVRFLPPFHPTGDYERDVAALQAHFHAGMALRPELFWEVGRG